MTTGSAAAVHARRRAQPGIIFFVDPAGGDDDPSATDDLSAAELAAILAERPELGRMVSRLLLLPAEHRQSVAVVVDRMIDALLLDL